MKHHLLGLLVPSTTRNNPCLLPDVSLTSLASSWFLLSTSIVLGFLWILKYTCSCYLCFVFCSCLKALTPWTHSDTRTPPSQIYFKGFTSTLVEIISESNLPLLPSDLLMDLLQFHVQPNCTCSCLISHWTLQKPLPLFYTWMYLTSATLLAHYLIGSHQHKYYCIRSPSSVCLPVPLLLVNLFKSTASTKSYWFTLWQ